MERTREVTVLTTRALATTDMAERAELHKQAAERMLGPVTLPVTREEFDALTARVTALEENTNG